MKRYPTEKEVEERWERSQRGVLSRISKDHPRYGALGHIPFDALPASIPEMVVFGYDRGYEHGKEAGRKEAMPVNTLRPRKVKVDTRTFHRHGGAGATERCWTCEYGIVANPSWGDQDILYEIRRLERWGFRVEANALRDLFNSPYECVAVDVAALNKECEELKREREALKKEVERLQNDRMRLARLVDDRTGEREDYKRKVNNLLRTIEDVNRRTSGFAGAIG